MKVYLDSGAFPPAKAHPSDAGYDLRTPIDFFVYPNGGCYLIDTGIHVEIPEGMYGKIESKSGLAVFNGVLAPMGVIDSNYRGPIKVLLYNHGKGKKYFKAGDKICQLILHRYADEPIEIVKSLDAMTDTDRGSKGFGSTGR